MNEASKRITKTLENEKLSENERNLLVELRAILNKELDEEVTTDMFTVFYEYIDWEELSLSDVAALLAPFSETPNFRRKDSK